MSNPFAKSAYRRVHIVEDRGFWPTVRDGYDAARDLVLTFDFALRGEVRAAGGEAHYLDHLADAATLQKLNFETYDFFSRWHRGPEREDRFAYNGGEIGPALRIELWSDVTHYARLAFNLRELRGLSAEEIFLAARDESLGEVLSALGVTAKAWPGSGDFDDGFYFPIRRWTRERLSVRPHGLKAWLRLVGSVALDGAAALADVVGRRGRTLVYLNHYHPLAPLLAALKRDRNLRVVSDKYIKAWDLLRQRRLPLVRETDAHRAAASALLESFGRAPRAAWSVDGVDMAALLYKPLLRKTAEVLPRCLRVADSIESYFDKRPLRLMVTFSNLGIVNALVQAYCRRRGIPIYLVINGLMANSFLDEAKDATVINAYGPSIKENYFLGMENIVCLGDPRMDGYPARPRDARAGPFKLVVGTAGFNNLDLNSYLAFEFDFLQGVLEACCRVLAEGLDFRIVLKVRANGYAGQYRRFLREYYPRLPVEVADDVPMRSVFAGAGLYVSIYSQTLFEASAAGVPAVYYKADTEQDMHPPFDGKSELVTATGVDALAEAIRAAARRSGVFDAFLNRHNMEKYIGPLDGGATRRNLDQVYALLAS